MGSGTVSLSSSECFSPFPHGTRPLSVSREYLVLPDGPGGFAQDSSCPALLRIPLSLVMLHVQDCHLLWSPFPKCSVHIQSATTRSYNPGEALTYNSGLGSSPVARHYWGNHCLFSLPGGTKMFQFPPFASLHQCKDTSTSYWWVVPFGNPGIKGYLLLPRAYRSLSRPSSPP